MRFLLLAVLLTILTVSIHCAGTYAAMMHSEVLSRMRVARRLRVVGTQAYIVTLMLCAHLCEAAIWAAAYHWMDALPDYSTALYYSLSSYSTVGYGDVVLPQAWRLLGPIESVVGVLMLGWSTAVIVTVLQSVIRQEVQKRRAE